MKNNDESSALESLQHKLQQFNLGMVWLDPQNTIIGMNDFALEVLGPIADNVIGSEVLQLHPLKSREKVKFLLDNAGCPTHSSSPMTMMINIPDRVLMIKVSRMRGTEAAVGTCLVFYDLTELTTETPPASPPASDASPLRQLSKLPVYQERQIMLVNIADVRAIKAEGHYSTLYTHNHSYFCNLSIADLQGRLKENLFIRVHRSYMVNINHVTGFKKDQNHGHLIIDTNNNAHIPISRAKAPEVRLLLGLN